MSFKKALNSSPLPNPPPDAAGVAAFRSPDEVDPQLWRGARVSAAVHGAILFVALVSGLIFHGKQVTYTPSIRVDLVGLPDIAKKNLSDALPADDAGEQILPETGKGEKKKAEVVKKAEPPAPDEMALKTKEKDKPERRSKNLKSAIDRIKALTAIENELNKAKPKSGGPIAKGNMLSKGNSLTGALGTDKDAYLGKLTGKVKQNWNLPVWLARQKYNAKVMVFLDQLGTVRNAVFVKNSGSEDFDERVLRAIRASEPFGTPPDEIVDSGITLGFPL